MHKYRRLTGLFLFILALCVCGCSGSGSSADPMGTGTVQFVAEFSYADRHRRYRPLDRSYPRRTSNRTAA